MKGRKSPIVMVIVTILAIVPSAIAAPKTTLKTAGRVTTSVVNTMLSGPKVPAKTVGINGDFYIDTKNLDLYGPKTNGVWKIATTLKQASAKSVSSDSGLNGIKGATGEKGEKGATGNTGATGSAGLNGVTGITGATGEKGSIGIAGAPGPTGLSGSAGSNGPQGAQGVKGDAGTAGIAGSNGAQGVKGDAGTAGSNGAQGVKGDAGTAGSNGAQGVKGDAGTAGSNGAQGVKGDAGTAGSNGAQGVKGEAGTAGVSISYFVDLGTWTLSTNQNVGTSDSNYFGNLDVGSYTFEIMVDGTFSPNTTSAMTIGMQVIASAGTLDYRVFASDSAAFINGFGNRHYQFMIIGKIICTGATTLKMRAIDQYGATASNLLNFTGRALVNKVGSIG